MLTSVKHSKEHFTISTKKKRFGPEKTNEENNSNPKIKNMKFNFNQTSNHNYITFIFKFFINNGMFS